MKTKLNGILTLLLALVVQVAFAQQTVTGTVTDPDGAPIFGATVQIKGTQTFTSTDFDGKYSVVATPEGTLVFSYTGYDITEVVVGNQTTIDVKLNASLEEVVVLAYRNSTQKRSNVATTTVTAKEIQDRPNASAIQRLQGQVSGLIIQTNSGQPGANSTIRLRGTSSLSGNTEPLIIIDGVPVDEDAFRSINPNDIETTTVLKDAAGTAIYGNRGANGAIIITTKRGEFDAPLQIQYSSQSFFTELIERDYNLYDAQGLLRLENRFGAGLGNTLTEAEINNFTVNQNWEDVFFRTGTNQIHNLSLSSGGKNVKQFTSVNYTDQQGALINSQLQRFNVRNNISGKTKDDKFTYNTNIGLGYSKNFQSDLVDGFNNGTFFNPVIGAFTGLPYRSIDEYSPELLTGLAAFTRVNGPFVTFDNNQFNIDETYETKIIAGANLNYKITDEWSLGYRVGLDYTQLELLEVEDPRSALARIRASFIADDAVEGTQFQQFSKDFRFNSTLNLGYTKSFGNEDKHTILANAYLEYVKGENNNFGYTQTGLDPLNFSPGNGAGFIADNEANDEFVPDVFANKSSVGLFSYFGEVDYDYNNMFGVSAVLRRDASSRFEGENRWGTFYSAAGRWNIDAMDFMQDVEWVNLLKLRVSYGEIGNERITGGYYGALNDTRTLFGTGLSYADNQTFVRAQVGNPNLRWETIATTNIGIDYRLFDNRLRGSLEAYERRTEDIFFNQRVSLINGFRAVNANLGEVLNRGVELDLNYDVFRSIDEDGFNLGLFARVNYNRNEVVDVALPDGIQDNGATVIQEGQQINEFFVVPYAGVNPSNGNLLFTDIDGNLTESPGLEDRRLTNTDATPDFQGGFGLNTSYKNFFFETQFTFMTGLQRFDNNLGGYYNPANIGQVQVSSDLERAWTPDNRVTDIPSLTADNFVVGVTSDRFLIDSDFLRLRFAQFGYNFPTSVLENTFLTSARIYTNAENLFTWTKWRGSDPESTRQGESNRYPTPRTFGFGVDLNF